MNIRNRIARGAFGGVVGTVALSVLRGALRRRGIVFDTAPTQALDRAQQAGLVPELAPESRWILSSVAHFVYGTATGMVFGVLRKGRRA